MSLLIFQRKNQQLRVLMKHMCAELQRSTKHSDLQASHMCTSISPLSCVLIGFQDGIGKSQRRRRRLKLDTLSGGGLAFIDTFRVAAVQKTIKLITVVCQVRVCMNYRTTLFLRRVLAPLALALVFRSLVAALSVLLRAVRIWKWKPKITCTNIRFWNSGGCGSVDVVIFGVLLFRDSPCSHHQKRPT